MNFNFHHFLFFYQKIKINNFFLSYIFFFFHLLEIQKLLSFIVDFKNIIPLK